MAIATILLNFLYLTFATHVTSHVYCVIMNYIITKHWLKLGQTLSLFVFRATYNIITRFIYKCS